MRRHFYFSLSYFTDSFPAISRDTTVSNKSNYDHEVELLPVTCLGASLLMLAQSM